MNNRTMLPVVLIGLAIGSTTAQAQDYRTLSADDIRWGDNSSQWANDGECDDPRFTGPGVHSTLLEEDRMADANDCRMLFERGAISYAGGGSAGGSSAGSIEWGNNSSQWANDGECDDPRFSGPGAAATLLEEDRMRDANDCRALFQKGQLTYVAGSQPSAGAIAWGDDSSQWANDGECDDPRFTGPGVHSTLLEEDRMHDASDCRMLFERGAITYVGGGAGGGAGGTSAGSIEWGNNSSQWANDGECDDPRFSGPGAAATLLEEDRMRDANDCRTLFQQGQLTYVAGSQRSAGAIEWGDDSSQWANDGECDDPRFIGPGAAETLLAEDRMRDATDCRTLFQAGQIGLRGR